MALRCSLQATPRVHRIESAAFTHQAPWCFANGDMHGREEGVAVAFGTLIMRSSWGLALYKILTPRIQKHFFDHFHRPSKAYITCIVQSSSSKVRDIA